MIESCVATLAHYITIPLGSFVTYGNLRHETGWECGGGGNCRPKRSVGSGELADLTLHISTEKPVLSDGSSQMRVRLRRSQPLLSPDYKLVVRDESGRAAEVNRTVPFPTCLYEGELEEGGARVAVSTCQDNSLVRWTRNNQLLIEDI